MKAWEIYFQTNLFLFFSGIHLDSSSYASLPLGNNMQALHLCKFLLNLCTMCLEQNLNVMRQSNEQKQNTKKKDLQQGRNSQRERTCCRCKLATVAKKERIL